MDALIYFPSDKFSSRFGDKFFTTVIKGVRKEIACCTNSYAVYQLEIFQGRNSWIVEKRYSSFVTLALKLKSTLGASLLRELPNLPPKTWFRDLSDDFLNMRIILLSRYLDSLLQLLSKNWALASTAIKCIFDFLDFNRKRNMRCDQK